MSACVTALLVSSSHAADLAYEISGGAGHTDNINRVEVGEQEEDIGLVGLRLSLNQQSARTQADVRGNVSYYDYLDDTYDSEVLGNLAANATFAIVPERFVWSASDYFGQVLRDPFQPSTPENRENVNQLATGPDVIVALGAQTSIRLSGRYILSTYEDSPFDSDTISAGLGLSRSLSEASAVSLNYEAQQTEFDEQGLDADYDQSEAFVRYQTAGARTTFSADVGYTELERDASLDSEGGLLLRLETARRISPASVVSLNAGREFANSGSAFASAQGFGSVDVGNVSGQQTTEPFTNDYVAASWDYSRNRTGLGLGVSYNEQKYDVSNELDQTLLSVTALASRQMSQRTSLSVALIYSDGSFERPGGDYDDIGSTLSFAWRLSQRLSLSAKYDHWRRSSEQPNGDYEENRIWLTLAYGTGVVRSRAALPQFSVDQVRAP